MRIFCRMALVRLFKHFSCCGASPVWSQSYQAHLWLCGVFPFFLFRSSQGLCSRTCSRRAICHMFCWSLRARSFIRLPRALASSCPPRKDTFLSRQISPYTHQIPKVKTQMLLFRCWIWMLQEQDKWWWPGCSSSQGFCRVHCSNPCRNSSRARVTFKGDRKNLLLFVQKG